MTYKPLANPLANPYPMTYSQKLLKLTSQGTFSQSDNYKKKKNRTI